METKQFFEDLQARIGKVLEESPAKDIEQNIKALLTQGFAKLDLVTREEFDAQALQLANIRARLDRLEQRLEELESQLRQAQARH